MGHLHLVFLEAAGYKLRSGPIRKLLDKWLNSSVESCSWIQFPEIESGQNDPEKIESFSVARLPTWGWKVSSGLNLARKSALLCKRKFHSEIFCFKKFRG